MPVYKSNLLPKWFPNDPGAEDRLCCWPTLSTAVLAASLFTHFTALLVCIKHQAAQRSTAGHLHCLTPRQQGKQAFYGGLVKPEFSHNSSKSDVNPLRRNPKKLFKHFLILVHFVKMIDKDDLTICWWDVGRHTVYQSLLARPLPMLHVLSTLNTSN